MGTKISKQTRRELLEALRKSYVNASKIEKAKILDEFIGLAGCHRKHAIRLLTEDDPVMPDAPSSSFAEQTNSLFLIMFLSVLCNLCMFT